MTRARSQGLPSMPVMVATTPGEPFESILPGCDAAFVRGRTGRTGRTGRWEAFDAHGQRIAAAVFRLGMAEGIVRFWFADGTPRARVEVVAGVASGAWREQHPNGVARAAGSMRAGHRTGIWELWHANGQPRARGAYRRGHEHGTWTFWGLSGAQEANGRYERGAHHGPWTYRDAAGRLAWQVEYRKGVRHGAHTEWWTSGAVRAERHYVDGVVDGPARAWYPDGTRLLRGRWRGGKREGYWWFWHADGKADRRGRYVAGEPVGEWVHCDLQGRAITPPSRARLIAGARRAVPQPWLRDPPAGRGLAWLQARNLESQQALEATINDDAIDAAGADLQQQIYEMLLSHRQGVQRSYGSGVGGLECLLRRLPGQAHNSVVVHGVGDVASERVLVDFAREARGHPGWRFAGGCLSPDGALYAWAADEQGAERCTLHVARVGSRRRLPLGVADAAGPPIWATDARTLLMARIDARWKSDGIVAIDVHSGRERVVHRYARPRHLSAGTTGSGRYAAFWSGGGVILVDRATPCDDAIAVPGTSWGESRRLDHGGELFYRVTPDFGVDIGAGPATAPGWRRLFEPVAGEEIVTLAAADGVALLLVNQQGRLRVDAIDPKAATRRTVALPVAAGNLELPPRRALPSGKLLIGAQDILIEPHQYTFDPATGAVAAHTPASSKPARPATRRSRHVVTRMQATAPDGTLVPLTVLHRRGLKPGAATATLLRGYGSHAVTSLPSYDPLDLQLADLGFVVATAHVRGGGELGDTWWSAGAGINKHSSFDDFLACSDHLVELGLARRERLACVGYSAGGLLVLGAMVRRPDLCRAVIARYPVADPITTMTEQRLRFGTDWRADYGDIDDPMQYQLTRAWSPTDALRPAQYPDVLVTAGLRDRRVPWQEAARFVARLRECRRGDSLALLKTSFHWGHYEPDDQHERLRETAWRLAFLAQSLGVEVC